MKRILAICTLAIAATGCASSAKPAATGDTGTNSTTSTTTTKATSGGSPGGVDSAIWDDYCRHGASLVSYLKADQNGTLTQSEFVSKLAGSENGIAGDAQATSDAMGAKFQALADAVGRVKVAASNGQTPDLSEILAAADALPTCK